MTRIEAQQLLAAFFAGFGKDNFVFDHKNFVKANIGEAILGFEFRQPELVCQALIYRFRQTPKPEVLQAVKREARNDAEIGGGEIMFDAETSTLSLLKIYSETVEPKIFAAQMQKLAAASLLWSSEILKRIADKVSGE